MSEFKVREVSSVPEKSKAEIEKELLEKHEEQFQDGAPKEETTVVAKEEIKTEESKEEVKPTEEIKSEEKIEEEVVKEDYQIGDEDVLSFIKNRYSKEINSLDDLFEQKESNEKLPEDVSAYLKFKKETGRGFQDFVNLNKDYDSMGDDQLLAEYWSQSKPHLDAEDIQFELDNRFGYDEDLADDKEKRQINIAKKEELVKAKKYLNNQKEQYGVPLESSSSFVSEEEQSDYEAYKKYVQESNSMQEQNIKRQEYFTKKTNELFSTDFKGFGFKVGDKEFVYSPTNVDKMKTTQSDITNFINSHVNEDGFIKDAAAYHKSLAVAMNSEAFAKFFYEQGKADAVSDITKEAKNVDMPVRKAPESISKGGFTVTAVGNDHGSGLRIRSKKNKN
jgi:hypothetical protein